MGEYSEPGMSRGVCGVLERCGKGYAIVYDLGSMVKLRILRYESVRSSLSRKERLKCCVVGSKDYMTMLFSWKVRLM